MAIGATTALLVAGAVAITNVISSALAARSAKKASETQADAATDTLDLQEAAFGDIQKMFQPYVEAGTSATQSMEALTGALGPEAQAAAIGEIESGPQFQAMMEQGENAILQNAAATGGLRGGNVQGALAQFRPQVLSSLIDQRYGQLGGLAQLGAGAMGGAGSAGIAGAGMMSDAITQRGAAEAGGQLAQGEFYAGIPGNITDALGLYMGLSGGSGGKI